MRNNKAGITRYRFDRVGNVVRDTRQVTSTFDTNAYKSGDRIFVPKRCSPARDRFRSKKRSEAS